MSESPKQKEELLNERVQERFAGYKPVEVRLFGKTFTLPRESYPGCSFFEGTYTITDKKASCVKFQATIPAEDRRLVSADGKISYTIKNSSDDGQILLNKQKAFCATDLTGLYMDKSGNMESRPWFVITNKRLVKKNSDGTSSYDSQTLTDDVVVLIGLEGDKCGTSK